MNLNSAGGAERTARNDDVTSLGGDRQRRRDDCGDDVRRPDAGAASVNGDAPASDDVAPGGDDITSAAARRRYMDTAFSAAREALADQEVPVGCVMVRAGRVLATARNTVNATKNATRHAEVNCVDAIYRHCDEAGVSAATVWRHVDVYVTVEPCVMCAAALTQLRVRSVTYGCANARFGGCGSVLDVPGRLLPSTVKFVQDETRVEEAVALLKQFYKGANPNVPRTE